MTVGLRAQVIEILMIMVKIEIDKPHMTIEVTIMTECQEKMLIVLKGILIIMTRVGVGLGMKEVGIGMKEVVAGVKGVAVKTKSASKLAIKALAGDKVKIKLQSVTKIQISSPQQHPSQTNRPTIASQTAIIEHKTIPQNNKKPRT